MSFDPVAAIAAAVLYEGHLLYPYRATALKNHQRWTFGGLFPQDFCQLDASETAIMQTECLLEGSADTELDVCVRFLHLQAREACQIDETTALPLELAQLRPVPLLQVGERQWPSWQEAIERECHLVGLRLADIMETAVARQCEWPASLEIVPLHDAVGIVAGALVRRQLGVTGQVRIQGEWVAPGIAKVQIRITNFTPWPVDRHESRAQAQLAAFVSTHTALTARQGAFISLTDPPAEAAALAAGCSNVGAWPVLVGNPGDRGTLLSAPIILYDYPVVAPESPGDWFDATEIDEMLTLRVLTLTDEEKAELRQGDPRGRAILDRAEALTSDEVLRLHGVFREPTFPEVGHG